MDTNELKKIVAKHFDYATPGTGQFLHGDWFTPKHKDSLCDLLDELDGERCKPHVIWREKVKEVQSAVDDLADEMEEAA